MKTAIITLRVTYNPEVEGSPDCWDWDEMLDTNGNPVEIVNYEEEE